MNEDETNEAPLGLREAEPDPRATRLGQIIGWGAVVAAIILVGAVAWITTKQPRSDEGRVTANVVGIAPRVSGPIIDIPIENDQALQAGDVLFEVDSEPYALAVAVAQANLDAIEGELINAQGAVKAQRLQVKAARAVFVQAKTALAQAEETYERLEPLLEKRFATPETVDTARHARDMAAAAVSVAAAEVAAAKAIVRDIQPLRARRRAIAALLQEAELALEHTVVHAPFAARVVSLTISEGAFARVGLKTITLIDTRRWWVVADFRESELRHIRVGDRAQITLATDPDIDIGGTVDGIGWGVTPMPKDPFPGLPIVLRQLDWVHIAQSFPVRIRLDSDTPPHLLRVGATASANILGNLAPEN
ncbi:MAG: HlyD family efflux transporter periplasmic adaptor subunit [Candidatus Binatia bacterium]|nr:HlyD family efflux transporter periplasmic adaptor subunit [Candidatus Binatia bacterium]